MIQSSTDISKQINYSRQTRENVYHIIKDLSLDEMNRIPLGFNNNVAWNLGHMLVTQQLLCYRMAKQDLRISEDWVERFKKGSKPEAYIQQGDLETLLHQYKVLLDHLEEDLLTLDFSDYNPYLTSYGIELNSISDAIHFNAMHEALHLGYMMSMINQLKAL